MRVPWCRDGNTFAPSRHQSIVEPMLVEPVVRNVVAGRAPSARRAPCAPVASVDLKGGVAMPPSQVLPAETVEEPRFAAPPLSATARFPPRRAVPVAK